ncbi:RNI-like protein [Basidiobolus meristosporus CBS 931.73]|uniref:RNI-like protein n=1 Tax=Basidiobolus meristosporus CBS 931.73 TaxID=1314790 RepID=A0A1Y1YN36_9FUNG|nr:RNI-like protein [Basidiobolus meristosporus CBS 931.73]|eukprot:ORX99176.1 RNI-like protein [Basidiobolus meristosporus CBS 931.73]
MPLLWCSPNFTTQESVVSFEKAIDSNPYLSTLVNRFDLADYKSEIVDRNTRSMKQFANLRSLHLPASTSLDSLDLDHMQHLEEITDLNVELSMQGLTRMATILSSKKFQKIGLTFQSGTSPLDLTILSSIPTLSNVVSLSMAFGSDLGLDLLRHLLTKFPNLDSFEINSKYTPRCIVALLAESCPRITKLSLGTFSGLGEEYLDDLCRDLELHYSRQLREFSIYFFNDWPIYSERFTRSLFKSFYNVETLRLSGIRLNNAIVQNLAESLSSKIKTLELTCVSYRDIFADEPWSNLFARVGPRLKNLVLVRGCLPPNIGKSIAQHCPILEDLTLACTNIADASVAWVAQTCGRRLRHLDVSDTNITKVGLRYVFQYCSGLQNLSLAKLSSQLELGGGFEVFLAQYGRQLLHLDLSFQTIGDQLLYAIGRHARGLRELAFTDQPGINDHAVSSVMSNCRKLKRLSVRRYSRTSHSISQEMLDTVDQHFVHMDLSHRDPKRF